VGSLGQRIAEIGRMPPLGAVECAPGAEDVRISRTHSAQRVVGLHQVPAVPSELAERPASAGGPALWVDDVSDSGWTLAVAALLPRRAGAEGVYPLVLAVQG
jgi:ATP-dependent DNA helicase RecQ